MAAKQFRNKSDNSVVVSAELQTANNRELEQDDYIITIDGEKMTVGKDEFEKHYESVPE